MNLRSPLTIKRTPSRVAAHRLQPRFHHRYSDPVHSDAASAQRCLAMDRARNLCFEAQRSGRRIRRRVWQCVPTPDRPARTVLHSYVGRRDDLGHDRRDFRLRSGRLHQRLDPSHAALQSRLRVRLHVGH